jgi:hypothetical protein
LEVPPQRHRALRRRDCATASRGGLPRCPGPAWHKYSGDGTPAWLCRRRSQRSRGQGAAACASAQRRRARRKPRRTLARARPEEAVQAQRRGGRRGRPGVAIAFLGWQPGRRRAAAALLLVAGRPQRRQLRRQVRRHCSLRRIGARMCTGSCQPSLFRSPTRRSFAAMPPKKKEVVEEKPILGRFSSHLKIGACGARSCATRVAPPQRRRRQRAQRARARY